MEMVTSRALVEGSARTMAMIRPDPAERVRSVQLYGVNPQVMARATQIMIEGEYADHIDLNFGCPVPKVTRKGGGAALPWKRDLYTDLLRAVVTQARVSGDARGREIPVTVKIRMGIDSGHETGLEAAQIAQELGAAAVTIHARTQTQHYAGQAHWDYIARVKEALDIPVFGNGDVFEAADAIAMMHQTGCDGISVGRGFSAISSLPTTGGRLSPHLHFARLPPSSKPTRAGAWKKKAMKTARCAKCVSISAGTCVGSRSVGRSVTRWGWSRRLMSLASAWLTWTLTRIFPRPRVGLVGALGEKRPRTCPTAGWNTDT